MKDFVLKVLLITVVICLLTNTLVTVLLFQEMRDKAQMSVGDNAVYVLKDKKLSVYYIESGVGNSAMEMVHYSGRLKKLADVDIK